MENIKALLQGHSRVKILVGEFGSGKTEFAVNYAIKLQQHGQKAAVVDIDLVKPYFRTREHRDMIEKQGVLVVAPDARLSNADLPLMPQALTRVLYDSEYQVVMDVGGGESAIVLAQVHHQLAETQYEAWMVINTRRPFTSSAQGIIQILKKIETVAKIKINGLVCNTNLAAETTAEHILEGVAIVEEASAALKLPIQWVVIPEWLDGKLQVAYPVFILAPCTRYPWME